MNDGQANESTTMIQSSSTDNSKMDVIEPEMVRVLEAKSDAELLQIACGMWRSAFRMVQRIVAMKFRDQFAEKQQQIATRRMSHGT